MKNESTAESLTAIHHQVIAAREGRDPRVIARLFTGWAVLGERQFVRGYARRLIRWCRPQRPRGKARHRLPLGHVAPGHALLA
jgi:hypothetical protein